MPEVAQQTDENFMTFDVNTIGHVIKEDGEQRELVQVGVEVAPVPPATTVSSVSEDQDGQDSTVKGSVNIGDLATNEATKAIAGVEKQINPKEAAPTNQVEVSCEVRQKEDEVARKEDKSNSACGINDVHNIDIQQNNQAPVAGVPLSAEGESDMYANRNTEAVKMEVEKGSSMPSDLGGEENTGVMTRDSNETKELARDNDKMNEEDGQNKKGDGDDENTMETDVDDLGESTKNEENEGEAIRIFGIKQCDTMKKAMAWLDESEVKYSFHDYKTHGIDEQALRLALHKYGWETVVNKNGMTWRKMTAEDKAKVTDDDSAIAIMRENTSVIKRPLIVKGNSKVMIGFDEKQFKSFFRHESIV